MIDVVDNSQIVAFNAMNVDFIRDIPDLDGIKDYLARLSGYEKALKDADRFLSWSVEFAKLEAAALIRACELGAIQARAIKGDRGKAAKWLFNMNEKEREYIISKCENGMTITQLWRIEVKWKTQPTGHQKIAQIANYKKQEYIEQAEKDNIIDISDFSEITGRHDTMEQLVWEDAKQGLRRALLKGGFIGTGNGEQIYVNPNTANNDQIRSAIKNRLQSILGDINNVAEIAHTANIMINGLSQLKNAINETIKQFNS